MSNEELKDFLKRRRIQLGLSAREVARKVGVNASTVTRWEKGDIDNMGRDKIDAYAKTLRISPLVIMGMEEPANGITVELSNYEERLLHMFRTLTADQQHSVELLINALYAEVSP